MKIDPEFRDLIPPLSEDERYTLEASLVAHGCRDRLVTWRGMLLDGHHRLEICERLKIECSAVEIDLPDRDSALLWIIENQRGRRNLSPIDRVSLGKRYSEIEARQAAKRADEGRRSGGETRASTAERGSDGRLSSSVVMLPQSKDPPKQAPKSIDLAAKAVGLSGSTLAHGMVVLEKSTPETIEKLRAGSTTINAEYRKIRNAEHREERTAEILESSSAGEGPSAPRLCSVLLADPPWRYEHSETRSREIENHYPTMSLDEICALEVSELTTESAVIYLWATSPKLLEAMRVLEAWGFEYRSCLVWVKDKIGMGYWARQRHELLLVGTKGKMPTPPPESRPDSVITAPRGEHSAKPVEVYELIERCWPTLPKLELFSRTPREGWDRWGHEA
jgi:N6-adenosine-specific RNA methylase IME4